MSVQLDTADIDWVRLVWTDLNGVARGISLPKAEYEHATDEGVGFANGVAELTLEPGLLDDPKYGPESGDMMAVPDEESLKPVSWEENTAMVFSDLTRVDGAQLDLCSRGVLKNVIDELEAEGYTPLAGIETEFSLMVETEDGLEPFNTRCSYDMDAVDQARSQFEDWREAMAAAGYEVTGAHQESQPGQYEVNIKYDDPLTAADGVMFFRHMLKAISRRHGLKATMMPRPYSGEDANGMHFHLSLWDSTVEENQFAAAENNLDFPAGQHPAEGAGISDDARYFIGGLLDHMKALTAICAPTVNSYKRLIPGIWAPSSIAWGPDNRSTVLRIPPELGSASRIEHRVPDTSINPYLAMAATLAAGLDGIKNETDPGEPTTKNAYNEDYETLPRTLWGALQHLEQDEVLRDALGDDLVTEFIKIKRDEFDRYQNHVTSWERDEYVDEF
ncbi:glutamine synthetase family protein [Haladaptatus sp. ZSTT2]|uniref:glutamine synthetase family protein n=1 Tax=Haladaptatus sp. ZSTT2 TaxID=3120515 RepID=UPI00300F5572